MLIVSPPHYVCRNYGEMGAQLEAFERNGDSMVVSPVGRMTLAECRDYARANGFTVERSHRDPDGFCYVSWWQPSQD